MSTALRAAFARHETFHPRYGWLVKGVAAAAADPRAFVREDATTELGVGKNMVRAIRYWCAAMKLLEDVPREGSRIRDARPTDFAQRLLDEGGWDPYLEDTASLWLLHWKLLSEECIAPAWWSVFNTGRMQAFDEQTLLRELRVLCDTKGWDDIVDNSLLKDIRCLLRMYSGVTSGRDLAEDSIDSPFAELDLIRIVPGAGKLYTVALGPKPTLPDEVVAFAVLDYIRGLDGASKLITIAGLAHTEGSPGRAFGLTEAALSESLQRASDQHPELMTLTHASGIRQVALTADVAPEQLLDAHYSAVFA